MDYPAPVVEDEFRGLHEIPGLIPPCTEGIRLLARDAVCDGERQGYTHLLGLVAVIFAAGNNRHTQISVFPEALSVAV